MVGPGQSRSSSRRRAPGDGASAEVRPCGAPTIPALEAPEDFRPALGRIGEREGEKRDMAIG